MGFELLEIEKKEDERGWLIEVLSQPWLKGREKLKHVIFSTTKPGIARGGHYHKRKIEWFCVVSGKAKVVLEELKNGKKQELVLSGEKPRVLKITPQTVHSFENIGNDEMHLLAIVNEPFNPQDSDTFTKNES